MDDEDEKYFDPLKMMSLADITSLVNFSSTVSLFLNFLLSWIFAVHYIDCSEPFGL